MNNSSNIERAFGSQLPLLADKPMKENYQGFARVQSSEFGKNVQNQASNHMVSDSFCLSETPCAPCSVRRTSGVFAKIAQFVSGGTASELRILCVVHFCL